jgi:polysaccharide deacetylase 2 family uncharacterized protein YibQ
MSPKPKSRKGKTGRKGRRKPADAYRLKVLFAALFLLGFLVVSLVLLSELGRYLRPSPPPPSAPSVTARRAVSLEDVRVELESALLRSGASLNRIDAREDHGLLHIEVRGEFPTADIRSELRRRLTRMAEHLRLESQPEASQMKVFWGEKERVVLHFRSPVHLQEQGGEPRLAIIMDDLGGSMATARKLLDIDLPVTLSIIPTTAKPAAVATLAHRRKHEVMIHIPMEPQDYPKIDPGRDALFVNLPAKEIRRRFLYYLDRIPYAVGGNNHMGSRFTEDRQGMATVVAVMKEEGLFFIDSLTSGNSIAFQEARRAGLPAAVRDVFLDNDQDVEKISSQIRQLAAVAKRRGTALGICHPHPQTLEALRRAVPFFEEEGIKVVPASRILLH